MKDWFDYECRLTIIKNIRSFAVSIYIKRIKSCMYTLCIDNIFGVLN